MHFKNKHLLNEEVLPPPCPPCILDMYISVSNKLTPSTALKSSSIPKIVPIGVGVGVVKIRVCRTVPLELASNEFIKVAEAEPRLEVIN
jgi:hypothetical protein